MGTNVNEKQYIISLNLVTQLLQYLGEKPYQEVFALIAQLQQIQPHEPIKTDEKVDVETSEDIQASK